MTPNKVIIYMNEHLHEVFPTKPVITVKWKRKLYHTNSVELIHSFRCGAFERPDGSVAALGRKIEVKYSPDFCSDVKTHDVRAWIEIM